MLTKIYYEPKRDLVWAVGFKVLLDEAGYTYDYDHEEFSEKSWEQYLRDIGFIEIGDL